MKYSYDRNHRPPFPIVQIVLHNPEEGLSIAVDNALVDTGADATLVPIDYLQQVQAPVLKRTRIRSHWGEWRSVLLFLLDIEIENRRLPSVIVVADTQGDEVILGRNVLNKLRIFLNGPDNFVEIQS
jgi:predicted aspartyl protease